MKKITGSLLFRIIACGIYAIFMLEIFFRIFSPVPIIPRYVSATEFGIRGNMPNMNYWHTSADFKINIRINSKGIRSDEEIPYDKPSGLLRIVVLGDSFGMGYEVNLEDSFLTVMKQNLENSGKKVQIVNLSVSGHGNAEELLMLINEGVKYHPDLVLLCWHGGTDLYDNVRSDLYELKNGILKRKAASYLPGIAISDKLYKIPLFIPMSENSHTYNWLRDETGKKIKLLMTKLKTPTTSGDKKDTSSDNSKDYSKELTIAILDKINEVCKKNNSQFMILDIPNQKSRFEFTSSFPVINGKQLKYPVVSPIDIFHNKVVKSELLINENSHFHFTPKACRLVGNILADYILNNRLL